ncbi:MAG: cyclase family protein [Nitrospiraceae bacterium]
MIRRSPSRRMLFLIGPVAAGLLTACAPARPPLLVDLTHSFGEETIYWPNNKPFHWEKTDWGTTAAGYWYASANFTASEHGGTHIDAPIHFGRGRSTLDQIPVERLIGPAVVIDVRPQCKANPDYELTVDDLLTWESRHGRIEDGALVLMLTGWGQRWPDKVSYLGSAANDPHGLRFPGFSRATAEFLVAKRAVRGVGIDTASIDPGRSRDFPAHQVLNGADVYALENVSSLDRLPPRGATVFALPIKIKGGTGGPVRIIAVIP